MEDKHIPTPDMEPSLNEVQQVEEPEGYVLPVKICEPTEVRELPSKRIGPHTVTVGATVGVKLIADDPRRKRVTLIARTQDINIGSTQAQSQLAGAWVPSEIPVVFDTRAELWAISITETTDVSVIEEYWA